MTDVIVNHFPRLVFDVITNEICPSLFIRITFRQRLEVIGLKSHAKYAVMSVCLSVRPASPRDTRAKTLGGIRHGGSRQPRRRTFSISLSSSSSTRSEKSFFWFSYFVLLRRLTAIFIFFFFSHVINLSSTDDTSTVGK